MAYRILIVDDSKSIRLMLKKVLKMLEYDIDAVFEAENGKEALEVLRNEWIDIVFTDIYMPEMDGLTLIQKIKEEGLMESLPIVVVSSDTAETTVQQAQELGAKFYIKKPFDPNQIDEALQSFFRYKEEDDEG